MILLVQMHHKPQLHDKIRWVSFIEGRQVVRFVNDIQVGFFREQVYEQVISVGDLDPLNFESSWCTLSRLDKCIRVRSVELVNHVITFFLTFKLLVIVKHEELMLWDEFVNFFISCTLSLVSVASLYINVQCWSYNSFPVTLEYNVIGVLEAKHLVPYCLCISL